MEEKKMNEAQSLALITSMINETRARITKNLGKPFLIWGYLTVAVALLQATAAIFAHDFYIYLWGWFIIPVVGWALMLLFNKQEKGATNYIDRCLNAVWCGIGVTALILPLILKFGSGLFPVIIILMGIGTVTTAAVVKNKTIRGIGYAAIFSSLLFPFAEYILFPLEEFCLRERYSAECIIFAVLIFLLLVVSGHVLNYKEKCLKN